LVPFSYWTDVRCPPFFLDSAFPGVK
jgi:hypothetical protein